MQNTLLHPDSTPKSSRQVARQNSELLDTLTSPSKGIFSQKQTQSAELIENLDQASRKTRGQFSHLMKGTIEDWKVEFDKHPEWQGLSSFEIQKRKEDGGIAFYYAFNKWKTDQVKNIEDKNQRDVELNRLKNIIFPDKGQFSHLMKGTIEDWKVEFDKHPEWQGLSTAEIRQHKEDGCIAFYTAFNKRKNKQIETIIDEEERKKEDSRLKNMIFQDKQKDRSNFTTIEDWKVEFDKHSERQGLSTGEIQQRKKDGGLAFYTAFNKWKNKQVVIIIDEEERKKEDSRLKNILFPDKYVNGLNFTTIEDWKRELDKHPEWQGTSKHELKKRKEDGGLAFYDAFYNWKKKQVKGIINEEEKKREDNRLKNMIFQDRQKDRSNFITIEDWREEFNKHSEWQGLSIDEIRGHKEDGGCAFSSSFNKWRKKQVEKMTDEEEKKREDSRLKNIIFPDKHSDRSDFKTIEDWKVEFDKHPEWQGLSTGEMINRREDGGSSFYQAFSKWKKKQTHNIKDHTKREEENKKLTMILFPEIKVPLYYTFNHNRVAFDSAGERKCAMILHTLGLAPTFVEGENLHVRSNGKALNSLDFKIGSVFLEYHPAQRRKTFAEGSQKKYKHITNLHHKDQTELYVFDDIYELYDIVRENRTLIHHVPLEKLHYLTHPDEFKLLVAQINKELVDYDTQNTKINNTQSIEQFISDDLTGAEINSKAA